MFNYNRLLFKLVNSNDYVLVFRHGYMNVAVTFAMRLFYREVWPFLRNVGTMFENLLTYLLL